MIATVIRRTLIVCCWILLILGALYWPKIGFLNPGANTINVFAWSDILHPEVIADFERETGIKVKFNYYASNEELLVKLKATKGLGYDLIIPSDYALTALVEEDLLQKLDKAKLPFFDRIDPKLVNLPFDPCNNHSIPFSWEIFMFAVNEDYFKARSLPKSWKLIFDPAVMSYKIAMTSDPIEATSFAAFYLFGDDVRLNLEQAAAVKDLLSTQKSRVEAYAGFRGDYFLSTGSCELAVTSSSYYGKTLKLFPDVGFIVPEEGTFVTIENLAIPKQSKKEALTYRLINYLFTERSVSSHFENFGFFPSIPILPSDPRLSPEAKKLLSVTEGDFSRFRFMREVSSQQTITDIWVEVKSRN